MSKYSYYYVKTIIDDTDKPKTYKFLKGNPTLFQPPEDTWSTHGRYSLLSRLLRGGLSGSGDVYHPGNAVFKTFRFTLSNEGRLYYVASMFPPPRYIHPGRHKINHNHLYHQIGMKHLQSF